MPSAPLWGVPPYPTLAPSRRGIFISYRHAALAPQTLPTAARARPSNCTGGWLDDRCRDHVALRVGQGLLFSADLESQRDSAKRTSEYIPVLISRNVP